MTEQSPLKTAMGSALQGLREVVESLKGRKDYGAREELKAAAAKIDTLEQSLLNCQAVTGDSVTASQLEEILASAGAVDATYGQLINANIEMAGKGQLDTSRTIEPSYAKAENKIVESSRRQVRLLLAETKAALPAQKPSPPAGEDGIPEADIVAQSDALQQAALTGAPFVVMLDTVHHALQGATAGSGKAGGQ